VVSRNTQSQLAKRATRCLVARKRFDLVAASRRLVGAGSYPGDVLQPGIGWQDAGWKIVSTPGSAVRCPRTASVRVGLSQQDAANAKHAALSGTVLEHVRERRSLPRFYADASLGRFRQPEAVVGRVFQQSVYSYQSAALFVPASGRLSRHVARF